MFGLTFVSPGALEAFVPGRTGPARALRDASLKFGASFAFVPWSAPWSREAIDLLGEADIAPFVAVDGPLWPFLERRGVEAALRDTLVRPEVFDEPCTAWLHETSAVVSEVVSLGARAIVIAEDLAGSGGLLVAPDFAIEVLLPRFGSLVRQVTDAKLPSILHSDGDIRSLLKAVRRAGFSAIHAGGGLTFDEFERVFWAARPHDLVVIGGVPTRELGAGRAHAEGIGSRAGLLARAGGLLLADDGGIQLPEELHALSVAVAAARAAAGEA